MDTLQAWRRHQVREINSGRVMGRSPTALGRIADRHRRRDRHALSHGPNRPAQNRPTTRLWDQFGFETEGRQMLYPAIGTTASGFPISRGRNDRRKDNLSSQCGLRRPQLSGALIPASSEADQTALPLLDRPLRTAESLTPNSDAPMIALRRVAQAYDVYEGKPSDVLVTQWVNRTGTHVGVRRSMLCVIRSEPLAASLRDFP